MSAELREQHPGPLAGGWHRGDSSVSSDVVLTAITSALLLVGNVLTLALLAHRGAEEVFAPYNFARRLAVGLLPMLCLGMNVGLVRFMPRYEGVERRRLSWRVGQLFLATLILATGMMALIQPAISRWMPLLDSPALYWSSWLNISSTSVVAMTYAYLRSELRQRRANMLNLMSVMVAPLMVVALAPRSWSAGELLATTGVATLATVAVFSLPPPGRLLRVHSVDEFGSESLGALGPLLWFSLARVPASVSMGFMTIIGPWLAASSDAVRHASYLLAGFSLAQGLATGLGALGLVLMPRIAGYTAKGMDETSAYLIEKGLFASMIFAAVATPLLWFQADTLVRWLLGADLASGVRVVQVVLLGVPGLLAHSLLSPVSDASSSRPVSTWAALAGLLVCAVGSLLWQSTSVGLAWAFTIGETAAAGILARSVLRQYGVSLHLPHLVFWLIATAVAALMVVSAGRTIGLSPWVELALAVAVGAGLLVLAVRVAPKSLGLWSSLWGVVNGERRQHH